MSVYRRRVAEVQIRSIELRSDAGGCRDKQHLLVAGLVWPRPAIAERTAVQRISFGSQREEDFSGKSWVERILFKETIQGPFALRIGLTRAIPSDRLREMLKWLNETALDLAGTVAGRLAGGGPGGDFAEAPFDGLSRFFKSGEFADTEWLGRGTVDACGDENWQEGQTRDFEIPLVVPRDIYSVDSTRSHGEAGMKRRLEIEQGKQNGFARVSIRLYN
jgi:hypothetical protein